MENEMLWLFLTLFTFCYCAVEIDESEDGSFLFASEYEEFCGVDTIHPVKGTLCEDDKLMSFLASLQVINPESVIALATQNKLQKVCSNTSKTIKHMESYLKSCTLQLGQDTYTHLLRGISTLHKKLCSHDRYKKTFMEFNNCYSQLQSEFDSCNGPAYWSDNSNINIVCKAYQEITDCYYIKTSVLCGNRAADVFKELVNAVVDSVITVDCSEITLGSLGRTNMSMKSVESNSVQSTSETFLPMFIISVILLQIYQIYFHFYFVYYSLFFKTHKPYCTSQLNDLVHLFFWSTTNFVCLFIGKSLLLIL